MNYKLIIYKYRFFLGYVIIGIVSLIIELIFYYKLNEFNNNHILNSFFSVLIGIIFSFWFNVRYNFKISKTKRNKSLKYFLFISLSSYFIQILIIEEFNTSFSYQLLRILTSGSFFWIAYLIHRKFSFKDFKKVGIAIYANGVEDIDGIFRKVDKFADFIHLDIVDKSFNPKTENVLSYKSEVVKAYWKDKYIEAHIMSKNPSRWINDIINHVNRIYIHININEKIDEVFTQIKKGNCECGIVIQHTEDLIYWEKYQDFIDSILILAIEKPGFSGQKFRSDALNLINSVNNHPLRNKISLNVDGGVNNEIIKLIKAEYVVSGSYVLEALDPVKNIMILQTSSQYESI